MVLGRELLNPKIPLDFQATVQLVFAPLGMACSKLEVEQESRDYGAMRLDFDGLKILFRIAKITPRKTGQFVTLWKRIASGPIQPFDASDPVDAVVVFCRDDRRAGQFVFPKSVLCQQGVFSTKGQGGRRAIRVYPPWDNPTSPQAARSQAWQLAHFLEMPDTGSVDEARARRLYSPFTVRPTGTGNPG
jgi:hypothetical protein